MIDAVMALTTLEANQGEGCADSQKPNNCIGGVGSDSLLEFAQSLTG